MKSLKLIGLAFGASLALSTRRICAGHHHRRGRPDDRQRIRLRPPDEERRRRWRSRISTPPAACSARSWRWMSRTMPAIRSRRARSPKRSPARRFRSSPATIARRRRSRRRKPMPTATCCRSRRPRPTRRSPSAGLWNVARVCGRDDQQGAVAGDYIAKNFKGKNIAILNDKTTYGKGLADETKKALNKAGVTEKMYESYNKGDKDFNAIVSRLKLENIDLVYVGGYHQEAGLILRQMRDQGLQDHPDGRRRAGRQGVCLDHRPRRRRHAVHLRPRSAQEADREGDRREVQGQEHRSRRLHALHLRRDAGVVAGGRRRPAPPMRRR